MGGGDTNYDEIADQYFKCKVNPIKKYSEEYSVLSCLGDIKGKSIVDIGCGDGYYTKLFDDAGAREIHGVDSSNAMIERAKQAEIGGARTNAVVEYTVGDASDFHLSRTFDLASAVYLLNYSRDEKTLRTMFQSAFDHLKPSGRFVAVLANPNVTENHIEAQKAYGAEIKQAYTDGAVIQTKLQGNGFEVEFKTYHWTQATMERIMTEVGFIGIEWPSMKVSPEGIQTFGSQFWAPFQEYPAITMLTCAKSLEDANTLEVS